MQIESVQFVCDIVWKDGMCLIDPEIVWYESELDKITTLVGIMEVYRYEMATTPKGEAVIV